MQKILIPGTRDINNGTCNYSGLRKLTIIGTYKYAYDAVLRLINNGFSNVEKLASIGKTRLGKDSVFSKSNFL